VPWRGRSRNIFQFTSRVARLENPKFEGRNPKEG
jgi:hypothetical protein